MRRPRVLGEYELDGGAFGPARGGAPAALPGWTGLRGEQRDTGPFREARLPRELGRPGTLWRAVLRRLRAE